MAAFNGISFRLNLPIFTKFRCGSLIGRNSFLSVISPYFDFVLILTCRVSGWRRQRQQFNSDNDSDIISDEQRATRPKRGHLRLVACRKRCIQEVGLRKEVPRDDTAAQGVRYPVLLPCLLSVPSMPLTPHFGCIWHPLAFSGFRQTKFRQFRLIRRNRNGISYYIPMAAVKSSQGVKEI